MPWVNCLSRAAAFGAALAVCSLASAQVQKAMGESVAGLSVGEAQRFTDGKAAFTRVMVPTDGLGPIFNQTSCGTCHVNPTGATGNQAVTRFGILDENGFDPLASQGGSLLQVSAIVNPINPENPCDEVVPEDANVTAMRITNGALGFGLIQAIPGSVILANESASPTGGIAHDVELLENPGNMAIGRFGWKAQVATILSFSGDAGLMEMGITNDLVGTENAPNGNAALLAECDQVADPEDNPSAPFNAGFANRWIDRLSDFQRFLANPPQTPKSGMAGEALFVSIGCSDCHLASSYTTPNDRSLEVALRNVTFKPYSDFLLQDMGEVTMFTDCSGEAIATHGLGDGIVQGEGTEHHMRTPPLAGVRMRDPMLHDGRSAGGTFANRLTKVPNIVGGDPCNFMSDPDGGAIWWHGVTDPMSDAATSANAFYALSGSDQADVVAFLDSLGRREFDFTPVDVLTGRNTVGALDLHAVKDCFGATGVTPDDECAIADLNQDGNVNMTDVAGFLLVYLGWQGDCNSNGTNDAVDIINGTSVDANLNGLPDTCCPGDLDGDNGVTLGDLGIVLAFFGCTGGNCQGDADNDGDTDLGDLGVVLANFNDVCPFDLAPLDPASDQAVP
jgi:CxxC motif-containing protein (DUF1111 family)